MTDLHKSLIKIFISVFLCVDFGVGSYVSESFVVLRTRIPVRFQIDSQILIDGTFKENIDHWTKDFILRVCIRIANPRRRQFKLERSYGNRWFSNTISTKLI